MPDQCGFEFQLRDNYFKAPTQKLQTKSVASEMPEGKYWIAKVIEFTGVYALMYAIAGVFLSIRETIWWVAKEHNLYTSEDLLGSLWEKSVGLPDTRLPDRSNDICIRRKQVVQRLRKKATVTLQEMQDLLDETLPEYGIWLSSGNVGNRFRYTFRYTFGAGSGFRDKFVLYVNIPWLAIDELDLVNSPMTWENLKSWLYDFIPSYIELKPVYYPQSSYCIITNPEDTQTVYAESDGVGGWEDRNIYWKEIDVDGTVVNHVDTETILPTTTTITRSFTDSALNLIDDTVNVNVITFL